MKLESQMHGAKMTSVLSEPSASRGRTWFVLLDEEIGVVMADIMASIMSKPFSAFPALSWLDREGLTTRILDSESPAAAWGAELAEEM